MKRLWAAFVLWKEGYCFKHKQLGGYCWTCEGDREARQKAKKRRYREKVDHAERIWNREESPGNGQA